MSEPHSVDTRILNTRCCYGTTPAHNVERVLGVGGRSVVSTDREVGGRGEGTFVAFGGGGSEDPTTSRHDHGQHGTGWVVRRPRRAA
jgi:hypothetical protein